MIIPLAAFGTQRMLPFLDRFYTWFPRSWVSFYHCVPGRLFDGAKGAATPTAIFLGKTEGFEQRFSTSLMRWQNSTTRDQLFSDLRYSLVTIAHGTEYRYYPKFGSRLESSIMGKIRDQHHPPVNDYFGGEKITDDEGHVINDMWYRGAGGRNWKVFMNYQWTDKGSTSQVHYFQPKYDRDVFVALFNSSLFYWYCNTTFDATRNLTDSAVVVFLSLIQQDATDH